MTHESRPDLLPEWKGAGRVFVGGLSLAGKSRVAGGRGRAAGRKERRHAQGGLAE